MVLASLLLGLLACDLPPRFIDDSHEIDGFLSRRSYAAACVGLKMRDDDGLRTYTAGKLAEYPQEKVATDCLCESLYDAEKHTYDAAVAKGLKNKGRDDLAQCLAPALDDTAVTDPVTLVRVFGEMDTATTRSKIRGVLGTSSDAAVRQIAAQMLERDKEATSVLVTAVGTDADGKVRAAAATSLKRRKEPAAIGALQKAIDTDTDGGVRAAALDAVVRLKNTDTDKVVCKAMMEDPDERMRITAIRAFQGTKREFALDCLKKKLYTPEESGAARAALLKAIKASPHDDAGPILCDGIHYWVKTHIKDKIADDIEGADIVKAQNDRDWDNSYACVKKARSKGGLSCYGRHYLAGWFQELGGSAGLPWCPGMQKL